MLSIDTGYRRDYGEGVAYHSYFATDDLMFSISTADDRLKNKDEVLALTFPDHSDKSMAIAADYLAKNTVYSSALDDLNFVVLTDASGANRVYASGANRFVDYDQDASVIDDQGKQWILSEDGLRREDIQLARLPAHRAFWFGWHAAFPDTIRVR